MKPYLYQLAAIIDSGDIGYTGVRDERFLQNLLNTVYFAAGTIAVIVLVIAGFMYVTSAGSPDKAKKAKNAILGAVIGLVLILLAFSITAIVMGALG